MKKINVLLLLLFAISTITRANDVQLANVSIENTGPGQIMVKFDVSWQNSWRINVGPANYDGVWVFFKYKTASGNWSHINLTGNNNSTPAGFEIYQNSGTNKAGAMIYRDASNLGTGNVSISGVRLGVVNSLPYDIDVRGFAVEVVYIPKPLTRSFFGDGNGTTESIRAFHAADNTATTNSVVPVSVDINANDDAELDTDGMYLYSNDTIQKTNPIGSLDPFPTMKALWCMKYELTQAGYRDFLNSLTQTQQAIRTTAAPTSIAGTNVMPPPTTIYSNYIQIKTPAAGAEPAVYGCNANGNAVLDEATDGEWIACNWLTWPDLAAYLDWSGLAPMSELQFERMARGTSSAGSQPAIYGEFAWGNTNIFSTFYTPANRYAANETLSNASSTLGNAIYGSTYFSLPEFGPVRSGIFATPTSNRTTSGAGYYGVMELSGNIAEYCITIGTEAGRSARYIPNGDGDIATTGNARLNIGAGGYWPGMEGNTNSAVANSCIGGCEVSGNAGIMIRGGYWYSPVGQLSIGDRSQNGQPSIVSRLGYGGGRGVLHIR